MLQKSCFDVFEASTTAEKKNLPVDFDYLLYALQTLSDDLATTHYRTNGGQKAPVVIRTRGHRLEGIWHSGSPLSMVINSIRGVYVCVPRNMTQAAGFYNTLFEAYSQNNN